MIGFIILAALIITEIVFAILRLTKRLNLHREKSKLRISIFIIFLILVISPVIDWGFQWYMLGLVLFIQAVISSISLIRNKYNPIFNKRKIIFSSINYIFLITIAVISTIIFPQYEPLKTTGNHLIKTVNYTLTDESRQEFFTEENDNRKVSMQFWYPADEGKYPLVVFSHGAFGYRLSNYSTYAELASNGYVVCSIDHTYHAFMTIEEDGNKVIANMDFINDAINATNGVISDEEVYKLQQDWMTLRSDDMNFVLNHIVNKASQPDNEQVYQNIDLEHIGVMGHSMGGATAAKIGRMREDVDAIIVIDGTMFGEITGFEDGKNVITNIPYSKPIMNLYNESHYYDEAIKDLNNYPNSVAMKNAVDSYNVVVKGSGHMNFTDLPIVSPFLAGTLGTGNVDARYCIEKTNEIVLEFFDKYLKSSPIDIQRESIY